jgi:hypothetical protein
MQGGVENATHFAAQASFYFLCTSIVKKLLAYKRVFIPNHFFNCKQTTTPQTA